MSTETPVGLWPNLAYADAPAAIAFLVAAFGFEVRADYRRDGAPDIVEHAELRAPAGGGVMLGTAGKDDTPWGRRAPGLDACYVVCTDPDALFARAVAAGAEVVRPLTDQAYGSREFAVRDPEGGLWAFGTYTGA